MKQHGGKREGAGRKSNAKKMLEAGFVASWFTAEFQEIKWRELVNSKNEKIALGAMCYLTDRIYGKAIQPTAHTNSDGTGNPVLEVRITSVLNQ